MTILFFFFFQLLHVDRVNHYKRYVDRGFPLIKRWTFELLLLRQRAELHTNGFEDGRLVEMYDPIAMFRSKYDDTFEMKYGEGQFDYELEDLEEEVTDEALNYTKKMVESMSSLITLINDAPEVI